MPSRNVTLLVRAVGARQAARDMTLVSRATAGLGASSRGASRDMGVLGTTMSRTAALGRNLALGLGVIGAAAIKQGVQFNATMEQQTLAFSSFLGGTQRATMYLQDLYHLAAVTPFEFKDVVQGSRTLLAFGMNAEEAKQTMTGLGDAIAAAGGGVEQIQRSTLALGQVQAAGVLHAQDLNQLVAAGVTSVPKLAKNMGLSALEFRKQMSLGKITSERFFEAQTKLWENDPVYSGMAAKQAKTFLGQLSTLHDYYIQTMGTVTEGLFESLSTKVMPGLIRFTQDVNEIWKRQDLTLEDKFEATRGTARKVFGPMLRDFQRWWRRNEVSRRLSNAFESAIKGFADVLATQVPHMIERFWGAFKGMGPGGKALTVTYLATKFGLTSRLLGAVGALTWGRIGKGMKGKLGGKGVMNITAAVVNVYGGKGPIPDGPGKPGTLSRWGKRAAPWLVRGARVSPYAIGAAATAYAGVESYKQWRRNRRKGAYGEPMRKEAADTLRGFRPLSGEMSDTAMNERMNATLGHMAAGGYVNRSGYYDVGERGRERVYLPKGGTVDPAPEKPRITHIYLQVDRRTLATAVHREGIVATSTR